MVSGADKGSYGNVVIVFIKTPRRVPGSEPSHKRKAVEIDLAGAVRKLLETDLSLAAVANIIIAKYCTAIQGGEVAGVSHIHRLSDGVRLETLPKAVAMPIRIGSHDSPPERTNGGREDWRAWQVLR